MEVIAPCWLASWQEGRGGGWFAEVNGITLLYKRTSTVRVSRVDCFCFVEFRGVKIINLRLRPSLRPRNKQPNLQRGVHAPPRPLRTPTHSSSSEIINLIRPPFRGPTSPLLLLVEVRPKSSLSLIGGDTTAAGAAVLVLGGVDPVGG